MNGILLEVIEITRSYHKKKVVDGLSFQLPSHCCLVLLGPNGAGKSTTMEMIEGLRNPDSGRILFKGETRNARDMESFGIQFQETALLPQLTVRESLETFLNLYFKRRKIEDLIELCQLGEFQNRKHHQISGGQRQRLLLAMALANDPDILLLDEPTTGLDPQARRHLWGIVRDIKSEGKSMILTTHYMDEAQELCDELVIMDHGKILAEGSPKELLGEHCQNTILYIQGQGVLSLDHGEVFSKAGGFEIHTQNVKHVLEELLTRELDMSSLSIRQAHLEDLFLQLTGKGLRS
ncbi:MAG: ABC transporter ATP-binding protein [Oligoflexales bacterium]